VIVAAEFRRYGTQAVEPKLVMGLVYDEDQEVMIFDFERLFHAG